MNKPYIVLLLILSLIFGFLVIVLYLNQEYQNFNTVERYCIEVLKTGDLISQPDYFGNPVQSAFEQNTDYKIASVASAGKDGKFGTNDDLVVTRKDWNKSRITGEWVGKKSKEFTKGLIEGLRKPSQY